MAISILLLSGTFQKGVASVITDNHGRALKTRAILHENSAVLKPALAVNLEERSRGDPQNTKLNKAMAGQASLDTNKGLIAERRATAATAAAATALFGLAF